MQTPPKNAYDIFYKDGRVNYRTDKAGRTKCSSFPVPKWLQDLLAKAEWNGWQSGKLEMRSNIRQALGL